MNKVLRFVALLLCFGILMNLAFCFAGAEADGDSGAIRPGQSGSLWAEDSSAAASLTAFVESVTDPGSDSFLPEEERIAVFDFDGTLYGELFPTYFDVCLFLQRALHDPTYTPAEDVASYAAALEAALAQGLPEPESPRSTAQMAAECFRGMTVEEYRAYIRAFMAAPAKGFSGMRYADGFYLPMLELVGYLEANGFTVFISSGSERAIVRELIRDKINLPPYRVIGSSFTLTATGQNGKAGRSYTLAPEDEVLIGGDLASKNQKTNKVFSIIDEIGQTPVLIFGNSSGDLAMAQYALQHGGRAYMLLADDTARDYGDPEKAAAFAEECRALGFMTVSMRDEFKTIYGDSVRKTDGTAAAVRAAGTLRVGTTGDYNPMSYLDPETGKYRGFDVALAEDLAEALGVAIEYVPTSWPTLMEDTLAGQFDLAICGITVTDARKETALMSEGYLENGKTILCRAEEAKKFTGLEDINRPDVRVMVNPGGLNEKFALENLPDATLLIYDVNQEIPSLVAEGKADIMITEIMEAGYYIALDSRLAAPLIDQPFTHGQLGVLLPPGSEDLLDFVNTFLEDEKSSGRIDELAREYIYRQAEPDTDQLQPAA